MADSCHDEMLKYCKSFEKDFPNNEKFFEGMIKWLISGDSDRSRGRCGWHISYLAKKAIDAMIYAFKTTKDVNEKGYKVVNFRQVGKIMHAMIIADSFFHDCHSDDINKDYCYTNYKLHNNLLKIAMPYKKLDLGMVDFFTDWAMYACFEFSKFDMETKQMLYDYQDSAFVQIDCRRGQAKKPYHKYEVLEEILSLEENENINCILDKYYKEFMKTGYPYLGDFKKQMEINIEQEWDEILDDEPELIELIEEYDRNFSTTKKKIDEKQDEKI